MMIHSEISYEFPWGNNSRYNSYTGFIRKKFGSRVQKLSIDAGFTCPNRDGTKGKNGCTFCNNNAFNPSYCDSGKSIQTQLKEGIEFYKFRYRRATKYLAYFQAYSNTYASIEKLKSLYQEALEYPGIEGLVIGTRPDCINDELLDYLYELNKKYFISLEYGIESCYDRTLERIHRGHDFNTSVQALYKTSERGIHSGVHIIFGLPGENREMMLKEAEILSALPIGSIKMHQLQIIRDTEMEHEYLNKSHDFTRFSLDEYMDFVIKFTEKLSPAIMIDRFLSEVPPRFLTNSSWGLIRYDQVLNKIISRFEELGTWQGRFYIN